MSDLTAELNLALCVDDDDTADYLTATGGLRGSLNTIDGLFNSTTGHNHSGAHQGGGFTSLNLSGALTVGGNLQVNGTAAITGTTHVTTITSDGLATLNSLDIAGTSLLRGQVTCSSGLTAVNLAAAAGYVAAGPVLSAAAGDLSANRGGTGYVFLGDASHYVGFDGTYYQMPTSWLYVSGQRVVTETAVQTLTNKTILSPSGDGNLTATGGAAQRIETGTATSPSITSGTGQDLAVTFTRPFASPPRVIIGLAATAGQDIAGKWAGNENNVPSASGFTWRAFYNGGGTGTVTMNWIAIGS